MFFLYLKGMNLSPNAIAACQVAAYLGTCSSLTELPLNHEVIIRPFLQFSGLHSSGSLLHCCKAGYSYCSAFCYFRSSKAKAITSSCEQDGCNHQLSPQQPDSIHCLVLKHQVAYLESNTSVSVLP